MWKTRASSHVVQLVVGQTNRRPDRMEDHTTALAWLFSRSNPERTLTKQQQNHASHLQHIASVDSTSHMWHITSVAHLWRENILSICIILY